MAQPLYSRGGSRISAMVAPRTRRGLDPIELPPVAADEALRRLNAALEQQARAIGQALHDEAGQMMTTAYQALAEAAAVAPPRAQKHLDRVRASLARLEEQLQRIAHELRPRILDDLGLVPALEFLFGRVRLVGGITVRLTASVAKPLPPAVETAVYRMVQEAITNITRHARATLVEVTLEEQRGALLCRIRDNGVGFDPARGTRKGLGLVGIRDRLGALGSELVIRSAQGKGTELATTIRLEKPHAAANHARRRSPDRS